MSNTISWLERMVGELGIRTDLSFNEGMDNRNLGIGSILELSKDHTTAKVMLLKSGITVLGAIMQHPNYWNIVGHLRVGDNVLCSVQKEKFDCNVLFRIHGKNLTFPEYECYKNNDTSPWGTYA